MTLREVHHKFFSFRNGIVAKAFSDAGAPHTRVFGLQLPQLAAIAREAGFDDDLARELWAERDCREARLLACYLFSPEAVSRDEAIALARDVRGREEADVLAWRLLARLPFASELPPCLEGYMRQALERNLG